MARAWIQVSSLSVVLGAVLLTRGLLAQAPTPPPLPPGVPPVPPAAPPPPSPEALPAPPNPSDAAPPVAPPDYPAPSPAPVEPFPPPTDVPPAPTAPSLTGEQTLGWSVPPPAPAPHDADDELSWNDSFEFGAFADAYGSLDFNFPKGGPSKPIRAYDTTDGFSLSWVGLDIERSPDPVGGVIALRFGPTADRLGAACVDGDCDGEYGLSAVKQGFVSWKPAGAEGTVQLDLGKFDTPFGAEVAESQYNFNYTRGALYWLGQPAYHTGFRLTLDLDRAFALKLLAVNGWNRTIDNNLGKSVGLQATLRLPANDGSDADRMAISLGYLIGPEWDDSAEIQCPPGTRPSPAGPGGCTVDPDAEGGVLVVDRGNANTEGLRHFLDLVVSGAPVSELNLWLNGSLGIDNQRSQTDLAEFETALWWGIAAAARYAIGDRAGIAARGEYYNDRDGYTTGFVPAEIGLLTGTLTFDYSPAKAAKLFVDGRVDWSNRQIFPKQIREYGGTAVSLTVGAVIMAY